jgi:CTP:molybdopterin cytidylyltransferase MocA
MGSMQIAAVILAAGESRRFGSAKHLVRIGGRSMLELVAEAAHEAGLDPVIAVVPPGLSVPPDVVPEINGSPESGLSLSLRLGLAAVPAEIDGALVLLGDQPAVKPGHLRTLIEAIRGDRRVIATRADGHLAPPVLLTRSAFHLADTVQGDEGLRSILVDQPEVVTPVDVEGHVPDIDTREDLEAATERCPGCGALYDPMPKGPIHEYIGASAACWAAFGELLAREFQDSAYGRIHRHTVDTYAVQHPGVDGRRQRQSIAVHLIGLCHWLEHGMTASQLTPITQQLASASREWPWLDPPDAYSMGPTDVLRATDGVSHGRLVREWAEAVWDAWSAHHVLVRRWAADALG